MHKASQKLIYFDVNILVFGIQWHNGYFGGIRNGGVIPRREKTKYTRKVQKLVFRLFSFCAAKIFISSGSESCSVYSLYVFGWRCYDEAYFFS